MAIILNVLAIIGLLYMLYYRYTKSLNKRAKVDNYELQENKFELDVLVQEVKNSFYMMTHDNLNKYSLSRSEYEKRLQNKAQIKEALKNCMYGNIQLKNYVKEIIKQILINDVGLNNRNIDKVINFRSINELTSQDKFEILLHKFKKEYGLNALAELIKKYKLDKEKDVDDEISYFITEEEIQKAFNKERYKMSFEDKINIITQRIYQMYKGYSVIDEIRDMSIDGVSSGVSGLPNNMSRGINEELEKPYVYENVWIFFKGKQIRLAFLSFETEKELIRVCKNIYKYNNVGQLSESKPYIINDMADGSRVVVARPPFAESWTFLIRKLDAGSLMKIDDLLIDENKELPIETIKWLIKGNRTFALTGQQGTGKTTMLMAIIKFINATFTLRIQETAFELNLRKIYPKRNILTFRETNEVSGQEGTNLQKKTDGTVNILGEVADAKIASLMIQMAQVASLFTIFTHHAKTSYDLVTSLRNNLLQTGVFNNEMIAEKQVADTIRFDIHLNKNAEGHRYIERITEIIPLSNYKDYPTEYIKQENLNDKMGSFFNTTTEYYTRVTDRKVFETKDIIRWVENESGNTKGKYVVVNNISDEMTEQILLNLSGKDKEGFKQFLGNNVERGIGLGGVDYEK